MNHSFARTGAAAGTRGGPRTVDRAVGDLRRGIAVMLRSDDAPPMLVLPAETASPATLEEFLAAMVPGGVPALLLAPSRAAGLDGGAPASGQEFLAPVALPLQSAELDVARLRALADPTRGVAAISGRASASRWPAESGRAALLLAKLGRLLPAVLVAEAGQESACDGMLEVGAADILAYPQMTALGLVQAASAHVPLQAAGDARVVAFRPADGGIEHLAILIGRPEDVQASQAPLARIHSECFTGDLLGSLRCDCGPQLHQAIRRMQAEGAGVLLYMAQEGRGIGLVNKLRAYALQDGLDGGPKLDTLDANRALGYGADERSFSAAATMLRRLGITRVRLLTNNPDKVAGLTQRGIEVAGRVSHAIAANGVNDSYLETKARRFGHLLG